MDNEQPLMQKVRFCVSAVLLYTLTALCIWSLIRPGHSSGAQTPTFNQVQLQRAASNKPDFNLVVGRPVRLIIRSVYVYSPNEYVDVTVDQGYYSSADGSWTLSGYHAQFDMASSPANNFGGETFVYGHNNDYVFGAFRHHPPAIGAEALVYTANNRIFAYKFTHSQSLSPDDVSVLNYQGPPVLLIQTCTGSLNEWRTMYWFAFDKVVR